MNTLKVLNVYAGNLYGGIESMLFTLARTKGEVPGFDMDFALCFPGRLMDELRSTKATTHDLGPVRARYFWQVYRARHRLKTVLKKTRYDAVILHASWPYAIFAPVVRQAGIPLIYWQHDLASANPQSKIEKVAARIKPNFIISNSHFSAKTLVNLFPQIPYKVLYYPVLPSIPAADSASQRTSVRQELQTPLDHVVITLTARLESWTGHHLLLDALSNLHDLPGWTAWIVGGPQRPAEHSYLAGLKQKAQQYAIEDRVVFVGQRNDVRRLLYASDIHCQPNTGPEPFGIAFIEALYCGLPLVTTAIGAAVEIVDTSCGQTVPADESKALSEALRELITNTTKRQTLSAYGPTRAADLCDPGKSIRELRSLIETLKPVANH